MTSFIGSPVTSLAPDQREISSGAGYAIPGAVDQRGFMLYTPSQILGASGVDKWGEHVSVDFEQPYFFLTVVQRNWLFRLSSPVMAVVSGRMKRISSMNYRVVRKEKEEDRIFDALAGAKDLYNEIGDSLDPALQIAKAEIEKFIRKEMIEVLPGLTNFSSASKRWKRRIKASKVDQTNEATDWLQQPNAGVSWEQFIEKVVYDLHIHGGCAIYKDFIDNRLENFDALPGGTVYRVRPPYFNSVEAYIQITGASQPQVFYSNEISYIPYLTVSHTNLPMIPLEALMSKIAEYLFFDDLMARQADGTKPPNKMVVITNPAGITGIKDEEPSLPISRAEQDRIQEAINNPVKFGVVTYTGNHVEVVDLTRENTMQLQNDRQKDIREDVATVFNATNMEVNLTGSADVSGRTTADVQMELASGMGSGPVMKKIANKITNDILPFRFGGGLRFEFEYGKDEKEQNEINRGRLANGEITINELREENGDPAFAGEEFDKPLNSIIDSQAVAGTSEQNPMFIQESTRR